ncbi:hypothetical protein K7432_014264, partial [Basidiobolus ranarum]
SVMKIRLISPSWLTLSRLTTTRNMTKSASTGVVVSWELSPKPLLLRSKSLSPSLLVRPKSYRLWNLPKIETNKLCDYCT